MKIHYCPTPLAKILQQTFITLALFISTFAVQAERIIQDEQGVFSITGTPTRIVTLEYSFVDALAVVGVTPVGVADDKNAKRILPAVRELLGDWTSVGMRSQPNLEVISQLKPDLIIADAQRHSVIYQDLSRIAPTLLLKSRGESYSENLQAAEKIAIVLNKSAQMQQRLQQHKSLMADYKAKLSSQETFQFAVVTDKGMWMHGPSAYAGSVMTALGLQSPIPELSDQDYMEVTLEQLLKVNPDWLLLGPYKAVTVVDTWQKNPLYNLLAAAKKKQTINVSPELWSLNRGLLAAEGIASNLDHLLNK